MGHEIPPRHTLHVPRPDKKHAMDANSLFKTLLILSWYRTYCLSSRNALQQPHKASCAPDLDRTRHAHPCISPTLLTDSEGFCGGSGPRYLNVRSRQRGEHSTSDRAKPLSGKPTPLSCPFLHPSPEPGSHSALFTSQAPEAFGWKRHFLTLGKARTFALTPSPRPGPRQRSRCSLGGFTQRSFVC